MGPRWTALLCGLCATACLEVPLQGDTKVTGLIFEQAGPEVLSELGLRTLADACHLVVSTPRDLDFLELFAGCRRLTDAFIAAGWQGCAMDVKYGAILYNFYTPVGKAQLLKNALRLRAFGLCHASPVCSTYVWMSRSTSKRSKSDPYGDTSRADIRQANNMSLFLTFIFQILSIRLA